MIIGQKRVTQWVQCERRTCKKWRKLPGHVDMKQLPEKWFCEMNIWNPESNNCDYSEDSDSDVDNSVPGGGDRSQILTNVKGPGTLSYRRIIFGPDGKVRSNYNEKSKTSYGLFSFAENQKSAVSEESADFQKKVGYWWSSAYDESGANFISACRSYTGTTGVMGTKKETKIEPKEAILSVSSAVSTLPSTDVEFGHHIDLIDAIQRYSDMPTTPKIYPKKLWTHQDANKLKLLEREVIECNMIRSCLLVVNNNSVSVSKLFSMIQSMSFSSEVEEKCRLQATMYEIRLAIRRMEERNEVDVFYNAKGELVVQSVHSINYHQPPESKFGSQKRLPPKLQNKHDYSEAVKSK